MIFRHIASLVVCEVPSWHKSVDPEFLNFDQNSIPTSQVISWHIIAERLLVRSFVRCLLFLFNLIGIFDRSRSVINYQSEFHFV